MFASLPVDVAPLACDLKPFTVTLFADPQKQRTVKLPPGALLRSCTAPGEGAQVLTAPDSGGTEMCVVYELPVDPKNPQINIGQQRTAVAKSLPGGSCPPLDHSKQGYPGKDWFFLGDNVILPNAFKVKAKVEKDGLSFLQSEKKRPGTAVSNIDVGTTPTQLYSISEAHPNECRKNATFFQGRYAACYRAGFYNQTLRGGWSFVVGLTKQGDYQLIESARAAAAVRPATR